ncbi:MAG TPA: AMP-binding protein [Steroidobacteraceae bacterium]|nr:AMP-binding protein [Steroidobacteraceae bacterium]
MAYRSGVPVRAGSFLADVRRVAEALPRGSHVLNVCSDRYRFTVAFAASLLTRKVSLLPSTHTPEVIRQLKRFAPDVFCITDEAQCSIDLPRVPFPERSPADRAGPAEPGDRPDVEIDAECLAAYVFTSGSTGTPLPYRKTWGRLVNCVRHEAERLGLLDGGSHTIVGTVPPQHMYGFESTVLLALQSGNAFSSGRPFYPADICCELSSVPQPRALVTTPVHLRTLLASEVTVPATDLVLSATAPLSRNLALDVERQCRTRLLEIYGSTETGQIACRRTSAETEWQLFRGVRLSSSEGQTWAQGGHIEQATPLCDVVEITAEDRFLLHGRLSDLVNIAGKRSSLAYLNHQLNAIPGVLDGAFFVRDESDASLVGVNRVAALVVAPGVDAATLTEQLRQRIDPVFLPRPLLFVDALPRNDTGKLPHEALHALAATALKRAGAK